MSRGEVRNCICGCGQVAKRFMTNGRFKGWRAYAAGHAPHELIQVKVPDDPIVLSYIAGIVDGEGCVYARAYLRVDGLFHTDVSLQVTMCSSSVIKYLHDMVGGQVYSDYPKSGTMRNRQRFIWRVANKKTGIILTALLPYLIEKRRRAEIAIELTSMMGEKGRGKKNAISQVERDKRSYLAAQIKAFNQNLRSEDAVQ